MAERGRHCPRYPGGDQWRTCFALCLFDAEGPCANAVKGAQRTKTCSETTRTLSLVWGTRALEGWTSRATDYYQDLLRQAGAIVEDVEAPVGQYSE